MCCENFKKIQTLKYMCLHITCNHKVMYRSASTSPEHSVGLGDGGIFVVGTRKIEKSYNYYCLNT